MQVFRGIPQRNQHSTVLTIGNFDGVHRGHRALLARLTTKAQQLGLPAAVMTFEPHPREYFSPDSAPARLTSLREKLQLLGECGVDEVYVCGFNAKFAQMTADEFVERIAKGLGVRHLIVGDDFHFGKGRSGNFQAIQQAGLKYDFTAEAMETLVYEDERVSSSAVREALEQGNLEQATRLLGRPYSISGRVIHGDKIGRQLGYATANIQLKRRKAALSGIFVVTIQSSQPDMQGKLVEGVASLGVRPTVTDSGEWKLEVHLFDFSGDLYLEHLTVNFLHKLRNEEKFDSWEELSKKIELDVKETKHYFIANPQQ